MLLGVRERYYYVWCGSMKKLGWECKEGPHIPMQSLGRFFKGWVLRSGRLFNSAQMDSGKIDFNGFHCQPHTTWTFLEENINEDLGFVGLVCGSLPCSDRKAWRKESLLLLRLAWLFCQWVHLPYCYCCCRFDSSSSVFQHDQGLSGFLQVSSRSLATAWVHWYIPLHGATTSWSSTSLVWDSHCWTTLTISNTFPIYSACWLFL